MQSRRFAGLPPDQRVALEKTWATLRRQLPKANITRKYSIDCLAIEDVVVCGIKGFRKHNSYFPFSGSILHQVRKFPASCSASKGALQFNFSAPLGENLSKQLIRLRLKEMAQVVHGKRVITFADSRVKAVGPMKHGVRHGLWIWYRRDGSVLRTAKFRNGAKVQRN